MQPFLVARDIEKSYNGKKILDRLSFELFPGEIFAVVGKTGVGKTTLLHCILGIISYSGTAEIATSFGFSPQKPAFYPELTLEENAHHFGRLQGIAKPEIVSRLAKLCSLVGLNCPKTTLAKTLSGGMAKRFDLVLAMLNNPRLLLLDEPASDLDPVTRQRIWQLLKALAAQGRAILLVSHEIEDLTFCSRIAILHQGKFVAVSRPSALQPLGQTFARLTCS